MNYNFKEQYRTGLEAQRRIKFADNLPPAMRTQVIREGEDVFADLDEPVRIAVDFTLYPYLYEGESFQEYLSEVERLNAQ